MDKQNFVGKFFMKGTDEEVTFGDKIHVKVPVKTPYGKSFCEMDIIISPDNIEQLLKDTILIFVAGDETEEECPIKWWLNYLTESINDNYKKLNEILASIENDLEDIKKTIYES